MLKDLPSSLLKTTSKISNITQNAVLLTRPKKKWALVSRTFLEEINDKLNNHLCYIQWRSTFTVTEWFRAIEKKKLVNSLNLTLQNSTRQYWQNYLKNLLICKKHHQNRRQDNQQN